MGSFFAGKKQKILAAARLRLGAFRARRNTAEENQNPVAEEAQASAEAASVVDPASVKLETSVSRKCLYLYSHFLMVIGDAL